MRIMEEMRGREYFSFVRLNCANLLIDANLFLAFWHENKCSRIMRVARGRKCAVLTVDIQNVLANARM